MEDYPSQFVFIKGKFYAVFLLLNLVIRWILKQVTLVSNSLSISPKTS